MRSKKFIGLVVVAVGLLLALGAGAAAVAYAALQNDGPLASAAASAVAALQGDVTPPASSGDLPADSAAAAATTEPGLVIVRVLADGPAAAAGMARGDILLEIEGVAVNTLAELRDRLADFSPGDTVGVTVLHGDDRRILVVKLGGEESPVLGVVPYAENPPRSATPSTAQDRSAVVVDVVADSPAAAAGLQAGDRIISLNGATLDQPLATALEAFAPGDTITLGVERDGASLDLTLTLGANPNDATRAYMGISYQERRFGSSGSEGMPRFGHGEFGILPAEPGAVIAELVPGGAAETAGLAVGDRITAVDGVAVETPQDLVDFIAGKAPGDPVALTVESADAETREVTVTLGQNEAGNALLGVRVAPARALPDFGANCGDDGEQPCEAPGFRLPFHLPGLDFPPSQNAPATGDSA